MTEQQQQSTQSNTEDCSGFDDETMLAIGQVIDVVSTRLGMTEYELVKRGTIGETTDVGRSWINVCNGLALSLGSTPRAIADAAWSLYVK